MTAAIGDRAHAAWIADLIPVRPRDGAEHYHLGAATAAIRDVVAKHHAETLAAVFGQPVEIVVFNPRHPTHRAKWRGDDR